MNDEKLKPYGIKGWLLFFILTLTILGPPWKAWRQFEKWEAVRNSAPEYAGGPEFALLHNIAWVSHGVGTTLGILTGLLLWKRKCASSVKFAIVSLWIMGPIISIIGHFIALELAELEFVIGDLRFLIVPTLSAALWTGYLLKSRRVENTYDFNGFFDRNSAAGMSARSSGEELA